jgi:CspA family cold shock protein
MPQGTIAKLVADRGFGFIKQDKGDIFFHCSGVVDSTFEDLKIGQSVTYEVEQGKRGPQAVSVRPD